MVQEEKLIRQNLIDALKAQIEAVETDDEFQYILNGVRAKTLAEILRLNVYGRDLMDK